MGDGLSEFVTKQLTWVQTRRKEASSPSQCYKLGRVRLPCIFACPWMSEAGKGRLPRDYLQKIRKAPCSQHYAAARCFLKVVIAKVNIHPSSHYGGNYNEVFDVRTSTIGSSAPSGSSGSTRVIVLSLIEATLYTSVQGRSSSSSGALL